MFTGLARKLLLLAIFFIGSSGFSFTQELTKIMGTVTDSASGEPVPFANIIIQGTSIGAISGFDGYFSIETRKKVTDTLVISFIGYKTEKIKIQQGIFHELDIRLAAAGFTLEEVEIVPGENPAEVILRNIIAHKEKNNRKQFNSYQYEVYSKVQLDLNNITEKLKNRKILKPFQFIFDYVDTSTVNGKAYLPVFLSESLSDIYFQNSPRVRKERIKASRISGLENESISQFLGDMYQDVNIYENYIMLFEKNFVSPVANFGLTFYKYYLVDSSFIDNKWCYQIMFKPRRKQELTFTGEFWVNDSSWAIKKVNIRIVEDANLNFINDLTVKQDYDLIEDTYWMLVRDYLIMDFNVIENTKKTVGLYGHKTSTFRDFVFDNPPPDEFSESPLDVYVVEDSYEKDMDYWEEARHEKLSRKEKDIYEMVDSIKRVPIFQTWVDVFYMLTNGYLVWGPVEVGPLYKSISFNPEEGLRLRIGGRTSNQFSTKVMFNGHVAYGTKDNRWKHGTGVVYIFSKIPRRSFGASWVYDMEQLGQSQNAFSEDNLFASAFRRSPPDKLSLVNEYKLHYQHEYFTGFSNTLNFIHRNINPPGKGDFIIYNDDQPIEKNSITTAELRLDTRFAYNEKFVMGEFERISLGTVYPVLEVQYGLGIPGLMGGEYRYHKLQLSLKQWFNVSAFGWSKYIIEGGKIWGTLPYPLLKLHPGNETFIFDEFAYNLMNYYEFLSDEYISMYYTHHFDGFFLNRIPLMRKLKFREVAFVQGVIGRLSEKNRNYSKIPENTFTLEKPYIEAGVGIENILKIFRIDAIWRLSHLRNPDITKFAIFFSFHFSF
ncbi:MAG: DUF5686 and carboxypeptidase regulatory-like domain-containing protein [Bacteroidales bacterium]|nr:DUF5686 and carboxypeptidase regulatory-like domain-containing protein [Bacteroidales bacterium]MCF8351105.1 DUF5686 and carboxypeptidase regulatory-like domain-containing protein [Bacteroidales bacterium]MCF8376956.1 DUF5686 and carboxypeptidase regulatory-like domain-containing protein [Bacteroidales bacterium]MCF8401298.1 DUF5686 and carboxypeptidase regulatory-like domain-containing protein [Bacteroidales bacterium]